MPLMSKVMWFLAAIVFLALAVHAHFPEVVRLNEDAEKAQTVIAAFLMNWGLLHSQESRFSYLLERVWGLSGLLFFIAIVDFSLQLGNIKSGLICFLPLHLFFVYGWWMLSANEVIEPEHEHRMWVAFVVALIFSPIFNYG